MIQSTAFCAESLRLALSESDDVIMRPISLHGTKAMIAFVEGLINSQIVDNYILRPLFTAMPSESLALKQYILEGGVYHASMRERTSLSECIDDLLFGHIVLFVEDPCFAISFDVKGHEKRPVSEPDSEHVIKGARESLTETLRINTALVRVRMRSPDLVVKQLTLGSRVETSVALLYMKGNVAPGLPEKVLKKLYECNIDYLIAPSKIEEQLVEDHSMFPQVMYTQRPDRICANLYEGRVALIVDGMPQAYILPTTLSLLMHAPEDYAFHWTQASFVRILRYVSMFIALLYPAAFISFINFHHEMIPYELALSLIKSKVGVPFPTSVELLLLLSAFEVLIEAGFRMTKGVGQAVSIVGALVVGQAAVSASFISPSIVVVVALSGIGGFAIPNQDLSNAIRVWRVVLVFVASFTGLFGMMFALMILFLVLSKIENFDMPYLYPLISSEGQGLKKDTLIRLPWWLQRKWRSK